MIKPLWAWRGDVAALLAGTLITWSLAPYNIWPLGIIAAVSLALLLEGLNGKQSLLRSFLFGVGMYGHGVSWVFGAIHDFGNTDTALALVLTSIFVLGLALVFALPFYAYGRYLSRSRIGYLFGFTAIWILGEWSRSWFLTGFPWLYLGYAHISTPLAGWAPVFGVFGLSFFSVASGICAAEIIREGFRFLNPEKHARPVKIFIVIAVLASVWGGGQLLKGNPWNTQQGDEVSVAIVQPNIPLDVKWNPMYRGYILDVLREQTDAHWKKDLIIWPEAAVPMMYHDAQAFLDEMASAAKEYDSALITGILYDDETPGIYYNSITGLGNASGIYFKQRLVPFGEYVPFNDLLRGLIDFFDLPNSVIYPGPKEQDILHYKNYKISPSICYEIVYPDLVSRMANGAQLLITISNDAWFGESIGPKQHFQMAQMRALENHRYLIRATNTGISGFFDPLGQVIHSGHQFVRESIDEKMHFVSGTTPFMRWGSWPVVIVCCFMLIFCSVPALLRRQQKLVNLPD